MKKHMLAVLLFALVLSVPALAGGYGVGDKATDFTLMNVDGAMISLADFRDAKGFIVIFTCNHCPYSVAYEDRIIALDEKFKPLGYPVIAINPNDPDLQPEDSFEEMQVRAREKGFTFPYLLDEGQKIYPQYGATRTPHVFVLQRNESDLIVRYIGAIDNNHQDAESVDDAYVDDAVETLLAGGTPSTPSTKAIGCSIKAARK